MSSARLILPLPPSINAQYRNYTTPNGRRMRQPTAEAQHWTRDAGFLLLNWRQLKGWKMPEPEQKVIVRLWFYWPNKQRRDTHNYHKLLLDVAEGILYPDDRWVLVRDMDFAVDPRHPRLELEIALKALEDADVLPQSI